MRYHCSTASHSANNTSTVAAQHGNETDDKNAVQNQNTKSSRPNARTIQSPFDFVFDNTARTMIKSKSPKMHPSETAKAESKH